MQNRIAQVLYERLGSTPPRSGFDTDTYVL